MKILLINQTFYPEQLATSQHVSDFALFLVEKGHEVSVVTDKTDYETCTKNFAPTENYRGIHIHRIRGAMFGKRSFFHRAVDGALFHLSLFLKLWALPRPDLIVSFTSPPLIGVTGTFFSWLTGIKSVQWLMDINPDAAIEVGYLNRQNPISKLLLSLFKGSLKLNEGVVVLDRWMKEKVVAQGVASNKIHIIPPWPVQSAPTKGLGDSIAAKKEFGWLGKTVFLYSGNHSIVHPLDTLFDGILSLRNELDLAFVFAGGGLRAREVAAFKETHGLDSMSQIPRQPREKLGTLLQAADVHLVVLGPKMSGLVHSSKIYGVLLAGKPFIFIGPKRSHVVDLFSEVRLGFHVEHGDTAGFLEVVKKIRALRKEDLIAGAVINRAVVEREYTRDQVCQRFLDGLKIEARASSPRVPDFDSKSESLR